jgi:hypothetical protein
MVVGTCWMLKIVDRSLRNGSKIVLKKSEIPGMRRPVAYHYFGW